MQWMSVIILWYIVLFALGIIFTPITRRLFPKFYDYGYPFAKAIGLLLLSYALFTLSTLKILQFDMIGIVAVIAIGIVVNYKLYKKFDFKKNKKRLYFLIAEEIVFFLALLAWTYIRSHQPAIRGLEKFMDYGFINSVLQGPYMPANDMWLAGHSINYYYFGHVTGAFLIKLSQVPARLGYNLILATLFAMGITQVFSIGFNIAYRNFRNKFKISMLTGILATFLVNLGGNLHTIYAFTKGYENENPVPFWQLDPKYTLTEFFNPAIFLEKLGDFYWYPNATRFIPFTIHEFPLYSYVVADLHGHVFDIPFVILTFALLYAFFVDHGVAKKFDIRMLFSKLKGQKIHYGIALILGFLISIHFMTNAFDAPIYLMLIGVLFILMFGFTRTFLIHLGIVLASFIVFSLPFTTNFEPFASSIGVNCAPEFLVNQGTLGPFIFEEGNCQISPWWQLVTLWGFFWFNFIFYAIYKLLGKKKKISRTELFMFVTFFVGTILVTIPEFFYAKDIYPSHFRANTMFKLGYQAFIIMGIASAYVFVTIKQDIDYVPKVRWAYLILWVPLFFIVALYPTFAVDSYYGHNTTTPTLDGSAWLYRDYPEYREVIEYIENTATSDTVILEAQGDSYTDYNLISAYTGIPTVAGWHVHQWLWRGSSDAVGLLIPDIQNMYQSLDVDETKTLLKKYNVEYVIIGPNEESRYENLYENKFEALGQLVFESTNRKARIYKIPLDSI